MVKSLLSCRLLLVLKSSLSSCSLAASLPKGGVLQLETEEGQDGLEADGGREEVLHLEDEAGQGAEWAELDLEAEPKSSDGTLVVLLVEMVENLHLANSELSKSEVHPGDCSLVSSNGSEHQLDIRGGHLAVNCHLQLIQEFLVSIIC